MFAKSAKVKIATKVSPKTGARLHQKRSQRVEISKIFWGSSLQLWPDGTATSEKRKQLGVELLPSSSLINSTRDCRIKRQHADCVCQSKSKPITAGEAILRKMVHVDPILIAKCFDITVAFQVDIKYCSVHANKNVIYKTVLVHTKITQLISVLGLALLDLQIQQWGTGGPQLMLLKWV